MFETQQATEANILEIIKDECSGALKDRLLPQPCPRHFSIIGKTAEKLLKPNRNLLFSPEHLQTTHSQSTNTERTARRSLHLCAPRNEAHTESHKEFCSFSSGADLATITWLIMSRGVFLTQGNHTATAGLRNEAKPNTILGKVSKCYCTSYSHSLFHREHLKSAPGTINQHPRYLHTTSNQGPQGNERKCTE